MQCTKAKQSLMSGSCQCQYTSILGYITSDGAAVVISTTKPFNHQSAGGPFRNISNRRVAAPHDDTTGRTTTEAMMQLEILDEEVLLLNLPSNPPGLNRTRLTPMQKQRAKTAQKTPNLKREINLILYFLRLKNL